MHSFCSESILWLIEHQVKPGEKTVVKDPKDNECEVEILDIFYVEFREKNCKYLHLSRPYVIGEAKKLQIEWKTGMTLSEIISYLGETYFIQINKRTIVRTVSIQGRDSDWKYLQIVGLNRFASDNQKWISKKIKLGRKYKDQIIDILCRFSRIEIKSDNGSDAIDLIYINPLDIIYIELSKNEKTIHLNKPFAKNDLNCYEIKWKTRLNADGILNYLEINNFTQVNRFQIINLDYLTNYQIEEGQKEVQIRLHDGSLKTIIIGKTFRNNLM
jgi:hypothetical protein